MIFLSSTLEEIKFVDWVAVDYDMDTLYIGKVANLTTERGETYFPYKMDGNKGKVKKGQSTVLSSIASVQH